MLKFSRLLIAIAMLSLGLTPVACAADSDTAYIVTYFDTNFADKDKVRPLAKKLSDASMKEAGNLRFEVLQRIGQPDQFVILEAWKDKAALTAHAEAAHTKEFREKLSGLLRSAYDERPHSALGIGAVNTPAAGVCAPASKFTTERAKPPVTGKPPDRLAAILLAPRASSS